MVGLLAGALALSLVAPAAARADETGPVRITITGLAPVALGTGTSLSMSGTIANTGLTTVTSVSVRLTLSTAPVAQRRDLRTASDNPEAYGSIPLYTTTTAVTDTLPAGAKADYLVSVDTDALPLVTPGVYVIGVEAVGSSAAGYVILGSARTLIPYVPDPVAPVGVTWLWPLATTPGQAPDDVLLGDAIPREIAPGGRLDDLLTAGELSPSITWVIDPQVLQVASEMANGYLVDKGGQIRAGTEADAAGAWLARVRDLLGKPDTRKKPVPRARPVWVMPYADPDADPVTREGLTTDLVRATTIAPNIAERQLDRAADGTLAWAAGGRIDQEALEALASAGVRTIVVRDRALTEGIDPGYTTSGSVDLATSGGRVRALVIDRGLLAALEMPQGNLATILAARQRFVSELAYVALEPTSQRRFLVAAPANARWSPSPQLMRSIIASLRGTPWTRIVPVSTLLAQSAGSTARTLDPESRRGREIGASYLQRVAKIQGSIDSLRSVLSDPLPITAPISSAVLRAESSAWRTKPREADRLLESIEASVVKAQSGIFVVPRDNVVFSGDRGSVPVTVTNDLDQTVRVGLRVDAEPAARLEAEPLPAVEIEPGRRASLEVPVRIVGGEALTVAVQLTDPDGNPFGAPVSLELRTTAYSRAALWVAVAAAIVLVLLVVFDIVRRARQRRTKRQGQEALA